MFKQIQYSVLPFLFMMIFFSDIHSLNAQGENFSLYFNKIPPTYAEQSMGNFKGIDSLYLFTSSSFNHTTTVPVKVKNLNFKRGVFLSRDLYNWYQEVQRGIRKSRTIQFIQFDDAGNPWKIWTLEGALPVEAGDFVMNSNGEGTATYLKYKLDRCFVKSWSTSGD